MTTDIEQSLVKRMTNLLRIMQGHVMQPETRRELDSVLALLPPPVDPLLIEAREIAAKVAEAAIVSHHYRPEHPYRILHEIAVGRQDGETVAPILAALRKAREEGVK